MGHGVQAHESRSNFQRYIGKRAVLDGFFGAIKRTMVKRQPGATLRMAYGSAGPNMAPGGRGEQSVPTTGTYAACRRVFDTVLTDEFRSTCVGWASGVRNELVYARPDGQGGRVMDHTACKYSPTVPLSGGDWAQVDKWRQESDAHKRRAKRASFHVAALWSSVHPSRARDGWAREQ